VLSWGTSGPMLQICRGIHAQLQLHMRDGIWGELSSGLALLQEQPHQHPEAGEPPPSLWVPVGL